MQKTTLVISILSTILVLAVLGALKKIESKIDTIIKVVQSHLDSVKLDSDKPQIINSSKPTAEKTFNERIKSVFWGGEQYEMTFEGVQHIAETKLGPISNWIDGLAIHPDGQIAFSDGHGTTSHMILAYWTPSGIGEPVVNIQYTNRSDNTDDAKSEENGFFWFFAGPLAFGPDGTSYFSLGSCGPNGLYRVISNSPVQIEKLYALDSTRSLQIPLFDKDHLYSTTWNGIFRYPILSNQEKPDEPWFSVHGENILFSNCLIINENQVIAEIVFNIPKGSSGKDYYIKSFFFDRANNIYKVLSIEEIGPMAISWDGQKMIHFNKEESTIDEFILENQ